MRTISQLVPTPPRAATEGRPYGAGANRWGGPTRPPLFVALLLGALLSTALPTTAAEKKPLSAEENRALLLQLMAEKPRERKQAAKELVARADATLVPALVESMFFTPRAARGELFEVLTALTGERGSYGYLDWVEYVGKRTDIVPAPGYAAWKSELFARIDPRFRRVLDPAVPSKIRWPEIVSGGVPLDGIPSLENPPAVPAAEADFLADGEAVYGVAAGGAFRAYPERVLSWHEMLNDTVGGEPVTLSYCTLCGSAVAYSRRTPDGRVRSLGTSGLLYRSNKLMYDRETFTLWSNLTGEAVLGPLAATDWRLEILPATLTTWREWRTRHPETTAMVVDWDAGRKIGFDYRPGAADRQRAGVEFPVWQKSERLKRNARVYALIVGGVPKAYPLEELTRRTVVNDQLGGEPLVLVTNADSQSVRAYRRGERTFRAGSSPEELVDETGKRWRLGEDALAPEDAAGTPLARLPGHVAFWFGWYGFYPETEVFVSREEDGAAKK
ncbi:MAG: DUF3179 domain-containing protein [Thermoanaerobaculia bacterium]|nr:DUF3179 domain-containing protein [Thermoanaerobaculia bacterium]